MFRLEKSVFPWTTFFLVSIERSDLAVKKASEKLSVPEGEKGAISNRSAPAIPEKQNSKLVESVNSRKRYVSENFASQIREYLNILSDEIFEAIVSSLF